MAIIYRHLTRASTGGTEIASRGVRVYTILGYQRSGEAPEAIAEDYDLPIAAVYEALAYAADHPAEMEAIERKDEAAERWILSQRPKDVRRDSHLP